MLSAVTSCLLIGYSLLPIDSHLRNSHPIFSSSSSSSQHSFHPSIHHTFNTHLLAQVDR